MANIRKIEQINEAAAEALDAIGLNTVAKLLQAGATPEGRRELQETTGTDETILRQWLIRADLFRINGVSSGYADLLVAAGVDSVADLATREGRPLHKEMAAINRQQKLVRQLPPVSHVERWVADSKAATGTPAGS